MRATLRNSAVVILASIAIGLSVSDIVLPWHPFGTFGMQVALDGSVVGVAPQSSAESAGIRTGDRINLSRLPLTRRVLILGPFTATAVGTRLTFEVRSPNGARHTETLVAYPRLRSLADNLADVFQCLTYFVSIVLAAALVLVRPSRITSSFFIFGLLSTGYALTPLTFNLLVVSVLEAAVVSLTPLAWIPLSIFALRFPHDAPDKRGLLLERALLWAFAALAPLSLYRELGILFDAPGRGYLSTIQSVVPPLGFLLAGIVFAAGYRAAEPAGRARIRWVIAGFLAGYSGFVTQEVLVAVAPTVLNNIWMNDLLLSTGIFAPIAVTYAIIRHRVLDIRIVVRRAGIYAALTTTVVALIAVMDFLVGKIFENTKIAALGEIGIAVILGLTLNPLHRRLETAVDAAIFRRRRAGEERLRHVADGLLHANAIGTISRLLVNESMQAFALASAAVFETTESGDYTLVESAGWNGCAVRTIAHESSLVLRLIAVSAPLRLTSADLAAMPGVPVDTGAPVLAVPIVFRGELDGFILFGAHRSGEEIDAEEISSLAALGRAAASAYDHLDAQAMRARLAVFEASASTA